VVVWPTDVDHDKSGVWICKNTRTAKGLTVNMIHRSAAVSNAVAAEQAEFVAEQAEYAVPAAPASPASLDY
jgi:hypothetical protein